MSNHPTADNGCFFCCWYHVVFHCKVIFVLVSIVLVCVSQQLVCVIWVIISIFIQSILLSGKLSADGVAFTLGNIIFTAKLISFIVVSVYNGSFILICFSTVRVSCYFRNLYLSIFFILFYMRYFKCFSYSIISFPARFLTPLLYLFLGFLVR